MQSISSSTSISHFHSSHYNFSPSLLWSIWGCKVSNRVESVFLYRQLVSLSPFLSQRPKSSFFCPWPGLGLGASESRQKFIPAAFLKGALAICSSLTMNQWPGKRQQLTSIQTLLLRTSFWNSTSWTRVHKRSWVSWVIRKGKNSWEKGRWMWRASTPLNPDPTQNLISFLALRSFRSQPLWKGARNCLDTWFRFTQHRVFPREFFSIFPWGKRFDLISPTLQGHREGVFLQKISDSSSLKATFLSALFEVRTDGLSALQ